MNGRSPLRYAVMLGAALVVVMAGLLSACAKEAVPPPAVIVTKTVTVTSTPTPTPTPPKEVFNIKFASSWAKGHPVTERVTKRILEPLEASSNGRLKFTVYGSGELVTAKEMLGALQKGTVDMAVHGFIYDAGTIPEASITNLPFGLSDKNLVKVWEAGVGEKMSKLYETRYNTKVLGYGFGAGQLFWSTKKPLRTLEDFKGLKMAGPGGTVSAATDAMGASTTSVPSAELYTALQRGVVDAATWGAVSVIQASAWDVIHYGVTNPIVIITTNLYINLDLWKRLPDDLKQLLQTVVREKDVEYFAQGLRAQDEKKDLDLVVSKGIEMYTLPPTELVRWRQATMPVWDKYATASPLAAELLGIVKQYPAD